MTGLRWLCRVPRIHFGRPKDRRRGPEQDSTTHWDRNSGEGCQTPVEGRVYHPYFFRDPGLIVGGAWCRLKHPCVPESPVYARLLTFRRLLRTLETRCGTAYQ